MANNQTECRKEVGAIIVELQKLDDRLGVLMDDEQFLLDSTPSNLQEYASVTYYNDKMSNIENAGKYIKKAIDELGNI